VASRWPAAKEIGDGVRLEVGPVEPASAAAWIQWADETLSKRRLRSGTGVSLPAAVLDELRHYVEQWKPQSRSMHRTFRWHGEIDPDELEHLVHAVFTLDVQLSHQVHGERSAAPDEGRDFYLVLVRALLHALEMDSPSRAAFADQLRSSWPIAVAAT
jgi:hypothetical protein